MWDLLLSAREATPEELERPYNIPWPFPHCRGDACEAPGDALPPLDGERPWERWAIETQQDYLFRVFGSPASRVTNIVSDECLIKTALRFYGLDGAGWQSDTFVTHVDWSRADQFGHPGAYSLAAIVADAAFVRRVRRRSPCAAASRGPPSRHAPPCWARAGGHASNSAVAHLTRVRGVQRVRGEECDHSARITYRSAADLVLERPNLYASVLPPQNASVFRRLWEHVPLPAGCPLFARKFDANVSAALPAFARSCDMLGLSRECLEVAR